jgi:hypothetical protein
MSDDPKNGQPPRPLLVIPASSGQLPTSPEEETKMPCPVCAVGMVSPTLHNRVNKFLQESPPPPSSEGEPPR